MCMLSERDYDFSDVQSKLELEACFLYEYARESRAAMEKVKAIRRQRDRAKGRTIQVNVARTGVENVILLALSCASGFPLTPWQCLSELDKERLLKLPFTAVAAYRYFLFFPNPPLLMAVNQPGSTTLDRWKEMYKEGRAAIPDSEHTKFGFFAVNLKYPKEVLIEEFLGQLRVLEGKPKHEFPPTAMKTMGHKPIGRQTYRDALNALGAMRLRYHCNNFGEAKAKMERLCKKERGMFYGDRRSFNRACRAALMHFQNLFRSLDSDLPLHFKEAWQK